jgi:cytochrome c biogenesis protein CcdA
MAAIPVLLLYNLVFVIPLIALTLFIYFGLTNVEKASEWKEKNIKKLHLVAGIVMLALGLIVILGFI